MENDIVIIDFETAGLTPSSIVFTVGAVRYNPNQLTVTLKELLDNSLYHIVNFKEQVASGRIYDTDTMDVWWPKQTQEAQHEIYRSRDLGEGISVNEMLDALEAYIKPTDRVYARGQEFERDILMDLYKAAGRKFFRRYNTVFDVRTYIESFTGRNTGICELGDVGLVGHISVDDCARDALEMHKAKRDFCEVVYRYGREAGIYAAQGV